MALLNSMLFPALLKLKKKETKLVLCDIITLSFGRTWRFAWPLATSAHGIYASSYGILKTETEE